MKKGIDTRQAFINSVMYSMSILQKGVQKVLEQLEKLDGRSGNMITNLDALAADQHSSKLVIVSKKLQKALSAVTEAKQAIDDVIEEVSSNLPTTEEPVEEVSTEEVPDDEDELIEDDLDESEDDKPNFDLEDNEDDVLIEG